MKKLIPLLLLSSLSLVACPTTPVVVADAKFRLVHASPDAGPVDLYVDDKRISDAINIDFKGVYPKDAYSTISAASHKVEICPTGSKTCYPAFTAKFESGKSYTLIAMGTKAATDDAAPTARPLEIIPFTDNVAASSNAANAKLRIIHAASVVAADKVDVSVQTLTPTSTKVVNRNVFYKSAFDADEVAAGNIQVLVNATDAAKSLLIDSGTVTVAAGKVYTAVAVNPTLGAGGGVILLADN